MTIDPTTLSDAISGARLIEFDPSGSLVYVWLGGVMVHIHDAITMVEVNAYTFYGDFHTGSDPTYRQVRESVASHISAFDADDSY